ncbi:hypothetical protein FDP41_001590 [Naegleria fowleri]|uniref:Transmembrane protein n=1 Tax=Naegleria fowleri TaxID=5763 RepID=A0A6A5BQ67_NAEFO|nr:uncharacterized protein FDP41_001590 [Naegleria fowleri]KAF0979247.1 hypothetical protein FDP41_001590 [Naegleria fowleri]
MISLQPLSRTCRIIGKSALKNSSFMTTHKSEFCLSQISILPNNSNKNIKRSFSQDYRSKPLFSHSEKNLRVPMSSIGAISSSSQTAASPSSAQQKVVVILPQDDRGDFMLLRDASGHCSLPKITIPSQSSSPVDIYQEIQNVLLQQFGYGYDRVKAEAQAKKSEFDSRTVIRPLIDFDFTHGNVAVSNFVYHAQLLEKVQTVPYENMKGKVIHYMAMTEFEKEVVDPELVRDLVSRYVLSFVVSQQIQQSIDTKIATTRLMYGGFGVVVGVILSLTFFGKF